MFSKVNVTKAVLLKFYQPVFKQAHKGTQGHALIIGGSYGKMGSVVLASKGALRSGCGLVTAFIPKCGYDILQISIPEVMVVTNSNTDNINSVHYDINPNAIGIGMGMGQEPATQKAFYEFLSATLQPLVLDADALNILSSNKDWISL